MTLGPHEANLRGEIALEQIRAVQESTWPGLQGDLERGVVREIADAHVVPIDDAPNLIALPGRHRAWVLPTCGVAVALERLDDEDACLHAHRAHLLEIQGIRDDADLRRRGVRVENVLLGKDTHQDLVRFGPYASDHIRVTSLVYRRMIVGVRYRVRERCVRNDVIEAVAPEIVTTTIGPYR